MVDLLLDLGRRAESPIVVLSVHVCGGAFHLHQIRQVAEGATRVHESVRLARAATDGRRQREGITGIRVRKVDGRVDLGESVAPHRDGGAGDHARRCIDPVVGCVAQAVVFDRDGIALDIQRGIGTACRYLVVAHQQVVADGGHGAVGHHVPPDRTPVTHQAESGTTTGVDGVAPEAGVIAVAAYSPRAVVMDVVPEDIHVGGKWHSAR